MRYVMADIHGEYEMFLKMLGKISFSDSDELYIAGDIIDKGPDSVRLAKYISKKSINKKYPFVNSAKLQKKAPKKEAYNV